LGGDEEKSKLHGKNGLKIAHMEQEVRMGFGDVHLFNLAMLGKEGHKLITRIFV
jgi:hypothetical protein